jgi:hypothetical protein
MLQKRTKDTTTYAQMGMAALLPGMQHMLTLMQDELDRMRQLLEAAQSGELPRPVGRPPKYPGKGGWDKFRTPEERSAEMRRRNHGGGGWEKFKTVAARAREVQRRLRAGKKKSVRTDAKISAMSRKGMRSYWSKMTAEQRATEVRRRRALWASKKGAAA